MKTLNYTLLLLLLLYFTSTSIIGQSSIEFDNFTPNWSRDIKFDGLENTHLILSPSIVYDVDSSIYLLYNLFGSYYFEGYSTYKIGYDDGSILWKNSVQSQEYNTRSYAQEPLIKENSYSLLINHEYSPDPNPLPILWYNSYLGTITYSQEDGSEENTSITNTTDTLNEKYLFPNAPVGTNLIKNLFQRYDTGYLATQIFVSRSKAFIYSNKLDEKGHLLSNFIDTVKLLYPIRGLDTKLLKNGQLSFFCYGTNTQEQWDSIEMIKILYDNNLNLLSTTSFIDIEKEEQISFRMLQSENDPYYYIYSYSNESNEIQENLQIRKFDQSDNLIEDIVLNYVPSGVSIAEINGKSLICYSIFENGTQKIRFLLSDGSDGLDLIRTLTISNEDYRVLLPSLFTTPGNDILLTLPYKNQVDILDNTIPFTNSWHLLKGADFISSSTIDQKIINNLVNLYPNPSSGLITFTSSKDITKVVICTITGDKTDSEGDNNTLDISMYPDGVYCIQFYTNNKLISVKTIIKN